MKKLIDEGRERTWYLVKEWVTKAGRPARIQQCVWSDEVKAHARSLPDHYCGYVLKRLNDKKNYYDSSANIHGGVTHEGPLKTAEGVWVGFDMAHVGDENIPDPLEYATKECEKLGKILKFKKHKK